MKTTFILAVVMCLFVSYTQSQITINSSDLPVSGDTLRYSNADINSIDSVEYTGTNYFWNFSDLKPTSQSVTDYMASSKTPYALYFLGSNRFGVKIADSVSLGFLTLYDIYNFYQNSSSVFETEGIGIKYSGFPIGTYYADKDEIYQFPLSYNDRDSSTFRFKLDLATLVSYSSSGYRINEVNGWGRIKTPYGTFNCLKVKTTLVSYDTIIFSGFPLGVPSTTVEYKWLAKGEKLPVLEVSGNESMAGYTVTSVKFRDYYRNVYDPNAPVADFEADNTNPTTLDQVSFSNQTQNTGLLPSYVWTFTPNYVSYENGTDAGSENPVVLFTKAGTYTVKLAVSNLTGSSHDTTKTDYITVIDAKTLAPVADFSANTSTPPVNGYISLTNNTKNKDNCTFEWAFFPDNAIFLDGTDKYSQDPVIAITAGGYYNVSLSATNKYGTHDTTKMNFFYVSGTSGMDDPEFKTHIYPNPVQDVLNVEMQDAGYFNVRILNVFGQLVLRGEFENKKHIVFDVSVLPKGFYTLEINNKAGKSVTNFIK